MVFFLLVQFVVVPMVSSMKDDRENTRTLREQLDKAREVIKTGADLQRNLNQNRADILALATNIPLPVLGNYLLGREQYIRSCCADLNVQVLSVAEYNVQEVTGWSSLFKIYRVRVAGHAGINELARCLYKIQARNPFTSVTEISVVSKAESPSVHDFEFVVAWLIWANPDKRPAFLLEPEQKMPGLTPGVKK